MIRILGTAGRINGWHLLDRELNRTHTIKWDATDKSYTLTPISEGVSE